MPAERPNPRGRRYLSAGDMAGECQVRGSVTARDEHLGGRLRGLDLTPACDRVLVTPGSLATPTCVGRAERVDDKQC